MARGTVASIIVTLPEPPLAAKGDRAPVPLSEDCFDRGDEAVHVPSPERRALPP